MKRINYYTRVKILAICFLLSLNMMGQCPPDDFPTDYVFLLTQEDVDNFIINYPNCTELQTLLIGDIVPSTITNLDGLINLESIGWLQITNVPVTNFQGLNNITTIDRFVIYYMPDLMTFEGLEGLESVTGEEFRIELCNSISNFTGLENLSSFDGDFFAITDNDNLNDISGLDCYFFTEEFRNGVSNYEVQQSLYPSIFDNCGIIILSNDDFNYKKIHIYPNPAKNNINIESSHNIERIKIFDVSGRLIKQIKSDFTSIDLSEFTSGIYILKIIIGSNNIINYKLIVD